MEVVQAVSVWCMESLLASYMTVFWLTLTSQWASRLVTASSNSQTPNLEKCLNFKLATQLGWTAKAGLSMRYIAQMMTPLSQKTLLCPSIFTRVALMSLLSWQLARAAELWRRANRKMTYSGTMTWKTDINTTYTSQTLRKRHPWESLVCSRGGYLQVELRHLVEMPSIGNLMESPLTSATPRFPEKVISP